MRAGKRRRKKGTRKRNRQIHPITFVRTEGLQIKMKLMPLICFDFFFSFFHSSSGLKYILGFWVVQEFPGGSYLNVVTSDPGPPVGGQRDGLQGLGTRGASKPLLPTGRRQMHGRNAVHPLPPAATTADIILTLSSAELELGLHVHLGSHHPHISEGMQWNLSTMPWLHNSLLPICLSHHSGLNLCVHPCLPQQPRSVPWQNTTILFFPLWFHF